MSNFIRENIIYLFKILLLITFFCSTTISISITNSTEIKLHDSQEFEIKEGCKEIVIPNNYKKLILKLDSFNVDRILITDVKIANCNETQGLYNCCSKSSTFCMENQAPTDNVFQLNYCIDYTYVYVCIFPKTSLISNSKLRILEDASNSTSFNLTESTTNSTSLNSTTSNTTNVTNLTNSTNSTTNSSVILTPQSNVTYDTTDNIIINGQPKSGNFKLLTEVIRGQGCHTTEFNNETECSSLGINSCKDPTKCLSKCSYVECRTEKENPSSKVFSMCVPSTFTTSQITLKCQNHIAFYGDAGVDPQIYKVLCDKSVNSSTSQTAPGQTSHTFFKFLAVLFGVTVLATFIASVYYRFKLSIDGSAPFDPPSFVPNFIFPRQSAY